MSNKYSIKILHICIIWPQWVKVFRVSTNLALGQKNKNYRRHLLFTQLLRIWDRVPSYWLPLLVSLPYNNDGNENMLKSRNKISHIFHILIAAQESQKDSWKYPQMLLALHKRDLIILFYVHFYVETKSMGIGMENYGNLEHIGIFDTSGFKPVVSSNGGTWAHREQ